MKCTFVEAATEGEGDGLRDALPAQIVVVAVLVVAEHSELPLGIFLTKIR